MKISLTARLKTAVFGDDELKIPGLVKDHAALVKDQAALRKRVDYILVIVAFIFANVFGIWDWARNSVADLSSPPAMAQTETPVDPVDGEPDPNPLAATSGRQPLIVVRDEVREIMSRIFLGLIGSGFP